MSETKLETKTITAILDSQKQLARCQAAQLRELAEFAKCRPPGRAGIKLADGAAEELAATLYMSVRSATNRILEAEHIVRRLPATLDSLERGIIDLQRVRATYQITRELSDEDALVVEKAVLVHGPHATYQEYRRALRRQAMKIDPDAAERRRKQKLEVRDVVTRKAEDGSAKLVATMLAGDVEAAYNVLNHLAHKAKGPNDTRALAQCRADVLLDLLLGKDSERVQAHINVTVPLTTLLGLNNQPGELSEYGPITAEQCRELAKDGVLRRLITDDIGNLVDVSQHLYASQALADKVLMRDRWCRQPGCRVPGRKCKLYSIRKGKASRRRRRRERDYILLCKRHRLMYGRSKGWAIAQPESGRVVFMTPTEQTRQIVAEPYEEPAA